MKGIMSYSFNVFSYFLRFIFGALFFTFLDSESAIAIACLGFFTSGPCLLPLCSLPSLYSFITFFILFLALVAFLGCLDITLPCSAWCFECLSAAFFVFFIASLIYWALGLRTAYCLAEEVLPPFSARLVGRGYDLNYIPCQYYYSSSESSIYGRTLKPVRGYSL